MKKFLFLLALAASPFFVMAQPGAEPSDTSWKKIYRATPTKVNDLVHTRLEVRFDYDKAWMYGKEWLTAKPHFYSTDSLTLDAKGMDIKEVAIVKGTSKSALKYDYDGFELRIKLDKTYKGGENYTIYIDYISKPNEVKVKGSAAINDAKGLYFINPKGEEKDKPTQIWTQGETEATSVWCPTIDKPNQKTTQEMYMTVPAKYVTLSNGLLLSQKKNTDGTRTDYWKMDLPHAPYLFFMGVGEFSIIKDSYKGKEVSYYVEKDQAPYARAVFGLTPEMIKFFSDRLGVDYPWQKYAQMVGRDYVSGAMENTTATLHQESAYQNARELTDGIGWESTIAHELFHQWFGDLVTTESWSNITVNESMADYSETLWFEYKYGRDKGDEQNQQDRRRYLSDPNNAKKDLVRFYYADKEDVFDNVSYPKGGAIHHMLRNYVGDDAYFKSLNNYLTTNKFKPGEAHQMRLAFEEVTGKDLSWFWNQWFFGSGHPIVKVDYNYDEPGKAKVIVEQTQTTGKIFKLPIAIDVYTGASKKRYTVWVENKIDTFSFNYTQKPDLINVDADKVMLWAKTDNKTNENFVHQWKYAPLFMDRSEALDYFNRKSMPELAEGLKDKFAPLRRSTVNRLGQSAKFKADPAIIQSIENLANTEKEKTTKAAAIAFLAKTKDTRYKSLYDKNINDSSYSVAGAALTGLKELEPAKAYDLAKKYSSDAKGDLGDAINEVLMAEGTEADFDLLASRYEKMPLSQEKVGASATFAGYLEKVQNIANVKKGIDLIIKFRNLVPEQFRSFVDPTIKGGLSKLSKAKGKEIEDYIGDKLK